MAYAAVISLANTIDRTLNSNAPYSISLDEKQQIISLLEHVTPFQAFLEKFPDKFRSLEDRMRQVANEAEDILEKISLSCDDDSESHPSPNLEKLIEEIALIAAEVNEIKEIPSREDIRSSVSRTSSSTAPLVRSDGMVGFEGYALDLKDRLCGQSSKLQVIPICGMGGVGKTTLARNFYDDPLIVEYFMIRVWVTISQDFSARGVFSNFMKSLKKFNTKELEGQDDDVKVHKILTGRRYLVVMDDIWSSDAWDVVRKVLPDDGNGSRIVLTTRLSDVASYPDPSSKLYEMNLMNADESWNLFNQKVFGDEICPSELEGVGKQIARSCRGLPLAIVVIAGLVSTVSRDLASWKEIAENVKSAETAHHDDIEEILSLSYVQLPQYLRPCFLYMGSFPEDHEIHVSRLIKLWLAEGFLKSSTIDSESSEEMAEKLLEELVKRNLVLVSKTNSDGRIKSCSLHDLMRDLCIRKAHESKFFLNVMDKHIEREHFIESIRNQRRVNVDSSDLSYLSNYDGSTIRSIKCSKNCSVEQDFVEGVRLVRVLDVEAADIESLPDKLFQLLHLRYLAINSWRKIPSFLLMHLKNLQTLIIHRRSKRGVVVECELLMPWCMPQLRHVRFHGKICFMVPGETSRSLQNLQTLSYVHNKSCTEQILTKIPNLRKMKLDCTEACLHNFVHLQRLENLEICGCWVVYWPKKYSFTFPKMLRKLTLLQVKLPWNNMIVAAGSLPNLQVLKLRGCSFIDGTWETTEGAFPVLEILLIEASVLEHWITESSHFPRLKRLLLRSCRRLKEIPNDIGEITTLELIEVKGAARKSLVESIDQIRMEQEDLGNDALRVSYTMLKSMI